MKKGWFILRVILCLVCVFPFYCFCGLQKTLNILKIVGHELNKCFIHKLMTFTNKLKTVLNLFLWLCKAIWINLFKMKVDLIAIRQRIDTNTWIINLRSGFLVKLPLEPWNCHEIFITLLTFEKFSNSKVVQLQNI